MSAMSLRLPNSLHARAREVAAREGISLNQFVSTAVAEKLAALLTEEYLGARAKRASRSAYLEALDKVPDVAPLPDDAVGPAPARQKRRRAGAPRRGST